MDARTTTRTRGHRLGPLSGATFVALAIMLLPACSDDLADGDAAAPVPSPLPDEMCSDGQVPQAVAYGLDDGSFRWVSCTEGKAYRYVRAVTDDAVYVQETGTFPAGPAIALDPSDGSVLVDAPELPAVDSAETGPIEVDGLMVTGGQDDPVTVSDADGNELWTQPGVWAYDDAWAIDDGAVFAIEREPSRLVAYELSSGDIRWEYAGDPYVEGLWPWHAEGGRLYTLWNNLQVRDTGTGELLWKTEYPPPKNSDVRLAGVAVDEEAVYVGVGTASSGGD